MDWDAISAVSGMLAAVGVVLSVVYLAVQVRRNTLATYSQTHYLTTNALAETAATIASSSELSRVYRLGLLAPDQLNEDEFFQFAAIGTSQFRTFENLFFQHRSGLVDEDFWVAHRENILWFFHCPGMQRWWKDKRLAYSKGFRDFLENSTVDDLSSPETRLI